MNDCPCCSVAPGEFHENWCDIEQCPYCGLIVGNCEHLDVPLDDRMPWRGIYPGTDDCNRLGLYAKMTARGWTPCEKDEPHAQPDLNTLYATCKWNREEKRWETKEEK